MESTESEVLTKPDDTEKVNQVFKWILTGASEQDIEDAIKAHWPTIDSGPLIVAAIARLEAAGELNSKLITGWCVEAMRDLYRRMVEIGDFAGALRAVKELHNLSRGR